MAPSTVAPPPPTRLPHQPALDGLRGLAVLGVLLFHSGLSWATGGFLGVSTFFTLSGFLITGLLLAEHRTTGRIDLRRFWARRFRRLAPAIVLTLAGTAAFAGLVADSDQLVGIRADALAALGYVANWRFVLDGQSYSELFDAPSPLLHMWSLGIEEQFYVLFPPLVAGVMWLARSARRARAAAPATPVAPVALAAALAALAGASLVAMLLLHGPGGETSRAYYGTDTRAVELLVGALLAVAVAGRQHRLELQRAAARRAVTGAGAVALAATVALWATADQSSAWLYQGGLAAYAVGTAAILAAAVQPGPVRRLLSWRPLRLLGLVSYGAYLYHWPVFLWLNPERTGLDGVPLLALRVAVTLGLAAASYRVVERPVRRGAVPARHLATAAPAAVAAVVLAVVAATVPPGAPTVLAAGRAAAPATAPAPAGTATTAAPAAAAAPVPSTPSTPSTPIRDASAAEPLRVLLVGDSVAFDAAPGAAAALEGTGEATVTEATTLGFSLSSPPMNWRDTWRGLLRTVRPEVVVVVFGAWDEGFVRDQGERAYAGLVDDAVALLSSEGARVVLVGIPASVDRDGRPRPRRVNDVLAAVPSRWPGDVAYLDPDPALSPGGRFASHLPGPDGAPERVRKLDGLHLCPAGAARLGQAVVDELAATWALRDPEPGWRSGTWALDPRYDDPRGACPP